MDIIRKLPFMSGCLAAILAGIISFAARTDSQTIYFRMAVMMFLFYILGAYVKNTVISIKREAERRKIEREIEEEKKLRQMKEERKAEALAAKLKKIKPMQDHDNDTTTADAQQSDFEPLAVSMAIKTKVKE